MFGLIILVIIGLLIYYFYPKSTLSSTEQPTITDEISKLKRAHNELQQCQLADPQIQTEKENISSALFNLIYKLKQKTNEQTSASSLKNNQSEISTNLASPVFAPISLIAKKTAPPIDNTNILLFIGAFLIVTAAGLFIGYSYDNLSNIFKFFALSLFALTFYLSGLYLYKNKTHLKPAGLTFLIIGLILFPLLGIGYHNLFPETNTYNVMIAFSLLTCSIYFFTYQLIAQKALIYLSLLSFLIFEQTFVLRFGLPNIFHSVFNLITAAIILLAARIEKIKANNLNQDFTFISHLLAPTSLLLIFQSANISESFLFDFGLNSGILALFYYLNLLLSPKKEMHYQFSSLALLSSLTAFLFHYQVEFLTIILILTITNFSLLYLGNFTKYCPLKNNIFAYLTQVALFVTIISTNFFNQDNLALINLIVLNFMILVNFGYTYFRRQPSIEYLLFFILSFAFTLYFSLKNIFPDYHLLPHYGILLSCSLPLLYAYLHRNFIPHLQTIFWLILISNMVSTLDYFSVSTYGFFLATHLVFFVTYYLLEKNYFTLYLNLLFPVFILFNLQYSQSLSLHHLLAFFSIISLSFLTAYYYQFKWFNQAFIPALIYQAASLFLVFQDSNSVSIIFSHSDQFLAYSLIILFSSLSFIIPYCHTKKTLFLQTIGTLLIFSFYSFMAYDNPYDFPFINIALLPWSLFFLCSHFYQKYFLAKENDYYLTLASFFLILPTTILAPFIQFFQLVLLIEGSLLIILGHTHALKNIKNIGLLAVILDAIFFISPFILDIPSWLILGFTGLLFLSISVFLAMKKKEQRI